MCGEGGEYETAVLDCPLFKSKRIVLTDSETKRLSGEDDEMAPVCTLFMRGLALEEKPAELVQAHA